MSDAEWDESAENEILIGLLIPMAQLRFDATLRDSDAADTKSLGMMGIAAAALGVLVAVHETLSDLWWIPAIVIGVAGLLFIAVVWPREFDFGPDLSTFQSTMGGGPTLAASRQMLTELVSAIENNAKRDKILIFWCGLALLVLALLGCVPLSLIRPS